MPNIIGYKDLSNLYIKPAAESTRTISDIDLKSASEPERVLNPIVSESYMRQYVEEHGGITPTGNITITENGENINVAPFATATVNVAGGADIQTCTVTLVNDGATPVSALGYNFIDSDGYYNGGSGLDANETRTMDLLIGKVEVMFDPGNYDYVCTITDFTEVYASYTNNVNCTVNYSSLGNPSVNIVITDTTLPASAEIHFGEK